MTRDPTPEQIQQALRELEERQAARRAQSAKAAAGKPDFSGLRESDFAGQRLGFTDPQVRELVVSYRASYSHYDPELAGLLEAKLAAALKADGYEVPPQPHEDRLRELMARHVRRLG